jgi:hypothetical protein
LTAPIVLGALLAAGAVRGAGLDLRLEGAFRDASLKRDVGAVCRDVLGFYTSRVGPEPALGRKPIAVCQAPDGCPRACLDRLPDEYKVNITCLYTRYYSQQVYQLAHESGHVWADPYRSAGWFAESVMEAMSLLALGAMAEKWAEAPPFENWKDYARHFAAYREDQVKRSLARMAVASAEDVPRWVRERLPDLIRRGEAGRPTQHAAAVLVEDLFRRHPKAWGALRSLGGATERGVTDFAKWTALARPEERPLVQALAEAFGPATEQQQERTSADDADVTRPVRASCRRTGGSGPARPSSARPWPPGGAGSGYP